MKGLVDMGRDGDGRVDEGTVGDGKGRERKMLKEGNRRRKEGEGRRKTTPKSGRGEEENETSPKIKGQGDFQAIK